MSSPRRPRIPVRGLIVGFAGLACALVAVEAALRVFAPQPLAYSYRHPSGITLHIPNATVRHRRSEFDHLLHFNSLGLRGPEVAVPKPPGVFRILVLGDSYTEAAQVRLEETFVERLRAGLVERFPDRRWEVVNGGVSGYGTAEQIRFFEVIGRSLEPDLVILAFCVGNDVQDNLRSRIYRWEDGRLEVAQPSLDFGQILASRIKEFASSRFHLVQFLRDRLRELRGSRRSRSGTAPWILEQTRRLRTTVPEEAARPAAPRKPPPGREITVGYLDQLRGRVAETNARFLLVAIPRRDQVTQNPPDPPPPSSARPLQQGLRSYAEGRDVAFLDLLPALRAAERRERTYNRIDGHFNAHGHAAAAAEMLRMLAEQPELLARQSHDQTEILPRSSAGGRAVSFVGSSPPPVS